jgi:hypothetical protein
MAAAHGIEAVRQMLHAPTNFNVIFFRRTRSWYVYQSCLDLLPAAVHSFAPASQRRP